MGAKAVVYGLTFARIPLAMLLILCFQKNLDLYLLSISIFCVAIFTDILDGYLARKWGINSIRGLLWDSLADKSIYIAAILSLNIHGLLSPLIVWGMIVRDLYLYVYRLMNFEYIKILDELKIYSRIHGGLMLITIILGFADMYFNIREGHTILTGVTNCAGLISLSFGMFSAHSLKLKLKR